MHTIYVQFGFVGLGVKIVIITCP